MSDQRQTALVEVRVLLLDGTHVLMAQRSDSAFAGYWNLPGGHVQPRECATCAAQRELAEEVGVRVAHDQLTYIATSHYRPPGRSEKISFAFTATRWDGTPSVKEPDRCCVVAWHPIGDPAQPIMPQAAEALRLLQTHQQFSTYALECAKGADGKAKAIQ